MSQQLLQDLLLLKVGCVPKLEGNENFIIQTVSKILINFKKYLHAFSLFIIHRLLDLGNFPDSRLIEYCFTPEYYFRYDHM